MVHFAKLQHVNGRVIEVKSREMKITDIAKCPHNIFDMDHYREDGSCKCNDPDEKVMAEWGYEWRDGLWRSPS